MTRRRRENTLRLSRRAKFWASVIVVCVLFFLQQRGKPLTQTGPVEDGDLLRNVSVASVYDGDTFKINLNCSLAVYCEKVPVRVRGVDCPEIEGKSAKEKALAQEAKAFTKAFLSQKPITLTDCGRDKYFRLLCGVTNAGGQDLAEELIRHGLGYAYEGGTKKSWN